MMQFVNVSFFCVPVHEDTTTMKLTIERLKNTGSLQSARQRGVRGTVRGVRGTVRGTVRGVRGMRGMRGTQKIKKI